MRSYEEYIEQRPKDVQMPQKGDLPTESEWLHLASLSLPSGQIWIGDAGMAADAESGAVAELQAGKYAVEVKVAVYGSEDRVSKLRVIRAGGDRGEQLGEVSVDGASIGVCDLGDFEKADVDPNVLADLLDELAQQAGLTGVVDVEGAQLICAESGFGDGVYPVFELVSDGQRVGIIAEFIEADTPHPFGGFTMPQEKPGFLSSIFGIFSK